MAAVSGSSGAMLKAKATKRWGALKAELTRGMYLSVCVTSVGC